MDPTSGQSFSNILGANIKMDNGRTKINGSEDNKVDDNAEGFTDERSYRLDLSRKVKRELSCIEDNTNVLICGLVDNINKSKERQPETTRKKHWHHNDK